MTEYSLCSSVIAEEPTTDSTRCEHSTTYHGTYRSYLERLFLPLQFEVLPYYISPLLAMKPTNKAANNKTTPPPSFKACSRPLPRSATVSS